MSPASSNTPGSPAASPALLDVRNLETHFGTRRGVIKAVNGVSFKVAAGGSVGIVGESGSGKSVVAMSVIGLIDPPGHVVGGTIDFKGQNLTALSDKQMQHIRGRDICLVFQDPMSALNPVYKVGDQVVEALRAHRKISRSDAQARVVELFRLVGIPAPERRVGDYPNSMSGGMLQRVVIAMALANEPDLLILDEPTTALDATIQAQILDLVRDLRTRVNTAVLLITHDIGVVSDICIELIVMYGGRIMEQGSVDQIVKDPKHPYTVGLIASIPAVGMKGQRLNVISGSVPNPLAMPPGCPFATRCPRAMDVCAQMPPVTTLDDGRQVACWLY